MNSFTVNFVSDSCQVLYQTMISVTNEGTRGWLIIMVVSFQSFSSQNYFGEIYVYT